MPPHQAHRTSEPGNDTKCILFTNDHVEGFHHTLENETTTPVGRVELRVPDKNASKTSGYGASAPNPTLQIQAVVS